MDLIQQICSSIKKVRECIIAFYSLKECSIFYQNLSFYWLTIFFKKESLLNTKSVKSLNKIYFSSFLYKMLQLFSFSSTTKTLHYFFQQTLSFSCSCLSLHHHYIIVIFYILQNTFLFNAITTHYAHYITLFRNVTLNEARKLRFASIYLHSNFLGYCVTLLSSFYLITAAKVLLTKYHLVLITLFSYFLLFLFYRSTFPLT